MSSPLMPKATAVWLLDNTSLTFDQVAEFCELHPLEVKAIADGEVNIGMVGLNPIVQGQLSKEEIARCEKDPTARLALVKYNLPEVARRSKGPRYTPVTKRGDKPDAIAWIIKTHPEVSDAQIVRLIGTTKSTIAKIRDRAHWNMQNIKPRDPVLLGLCKQTDLDAAIAKARKKLPKEKQEELAKADAAPTADLGQADQPSDAGFEQLMKTAG
ncbi:MAG: DUF1013 domain-containing protein [Proteobacteria bacterium]|nr:DUF1013 domain-containing protein [Pseudomonadota bacterium]